jgi:hypothetical protein
VVRSLSFYYLRNAHGQAVQICFRVRSLEATPKRINLLRSSARLQELAGRGPGPHAQRFVFVLTTRSIWNAFRSIWNKIAYPQAGAALAEQEEKAPACTGARFRSALHFGGASDRGPQDCAARLRIGEGGRPEPPARQAAEVARENPLDFISAKMQTASTETPTQSVRASIPKLNLDPFERPAPFAPAARGEWDSRGRTL